MLIGANDATTHKLWTLGGMMEIKRPGGYTIVVDDDIPVELLKFTWYIRMGRGKPQGVWTRIDEEGLYLHRIIMGAKPGEYVDHINGNTLDNRLRNLRLCTNSENLRNRGAQSNNTSGYKGVWWHKQAKKWSAMICVNKKRHYLGLFATAQEAACAYDNAAITYHGAFAKLNSGQINATE